MKNNYWLKFGCFLIGYNYERLQECGEVSKKSVRKYTSALLIIMIIWFFNGLNFSLRYISDTNTNSILKFVTSILSGIICVVIVVQIERQIILNLKPNGWLKIFRLGLGILMALIGSLIVDQILLAKDFDSIKANNLKDNFTDSVSNENRNNNLISERNHLFRENSILDSISSITRTNKEFLSGNRLNTVSNKLLDTSGKKIGQKDITTSNDLSPVLLSLKRDSVEKIHNNDRIKEIGIEIRNNQESLKKQKRPTSEGFLSEIKLLIELISTSNLTIAVWFFWFLLLFTLEMLVLIAKSNDNLTDYEKNVLSELELNIIKIESLRRNSNERYNPTNETKNS